MARAKTTRQQSDEQETFVAELYRFDSGRRSRSSGAAWDDPVDVVTDSLSIECESTERASYSLTLRFWRESVDKSHNGREPALAIRFRDTNTGKHTDLLVQSIHADAELRQKNEDLRDEIGRLRREMEILMREVNNFTGNA
jgi:hypothetical protein